MKRNLYKKIVILIYHSFFVSIAYGINQDSEYNSINTIEKYRELRLEKLNKPRSVIHNNDGCDAIYYPINEKYSVKNFLEKRSTGLIGTGVSTISYCTVSSGFGNFTHNTKKGEVLIKHGHEFGLYENARNITAEMISDGTDPLQANVEFAREHGFEIFWSNRMNDSHDAVHTISNPFYLWTNFKENNPQFLFEENGTKLPHGRWSSVDYNHKEVRDLCIQFYKEVCENYDIDGVEMDFLRHFELFRTVGNGGFASNEQLNMITDMVSQIRKVTEEAGMKRGNPILLLVRIPTSPEYARKAGVDIKRWIDEGLVDIVVGSCYFRLDFWKNFVQLGEGKEVKIYAGLSESRVRNEHPLLYRQQNSVFRARASAAWEAGIDGIYSFNEYNSRAKYLSEIVAMDNLRNTNNLYFVTYRDYTASRYLNGGNDFFKMPRLSPASGNHLDLNSGPFNLQIEFGDESAKADVFVLIYADNPCSENLNVNLNGHSVEFKIKTVDGLYVFKVDQSIVKSGMNVLTINGGNADKSTILKDASIFFLRDKDDIEMRKLIALCK